MQSSLFDIEAPSGAPLPERAAPTTFESLHHTPIGLMRALTDRDSLLSLEFCPELGSGTPIIGPADPVGRNLGVQLGEYFAGTRQGFEIPLRLMGTPFQVRVWKALLAIPFGKTVCYSELAERLGVKNGQRAVGMANRVNPVAVVVPCHRVVQADGQLCGYAGGLWRKQHLLGLESGQRGLF